MHGIGTPLVITMLAKIQRIGWITYYMLLQNKVLRDMSAAVSFGARTTPTRYKRGRWQMALIRVCHRPLYLPIKLRFTFKSPFIFIWPMSIRGVSSVLQKVNWTKAHLFVVRRLLHFLNTSANITPLGDGINLVRTMRTCSLSCRRGIPLDIKIAESKPVLK